MTSVHSIVGKEERQQALKEQADSPVKDACRHAVRKKVKMMSKEAALREYSRKLDDLEKLALNCDFNLYFHEDGGFALNSRLESESHELGHEISDVFLFLNGYNEGYHKGYEQGECRGIPE